MRIIYFHSLYGDLARLEKIRKIAAGEKADVVICGGDFWRYEWGWIDDYVKLVKEMGNKGKRIYIQCYGDSDQVFNEKASKPMESDGFRSCINENSVTVGHQKFVSIPYVVDPRFSLKHFYRVEPGFEEEHTIGEMRYPAREHSNMAIPKGNFRDMDEQMAKLDLKIDHHTILIAHNPPLVDSYLAKDANMVNRGSSEITKIINQCQPYLIFCGHVTNDMLEMENSSCWEHVYQLGKGKTSLILNPGRNFVAAVEIRKKQYLYQRIKI